MISPLLQFRLKVRNRGPGKPQPLWLRLAVTYQSQGDDLIGRDVQLDLIVVNIERVSRFLKQITLIGFSQRKAGRQCDFASVAVALVQADDESIAIFGPLDRFDDDIRRGYRDE